jgi:hypothetical protein
VHEIAISDLRFQILNSFRCWQKNDRNGIIPLSPFIFLSPHFSVGLFHLPALVFLPLVFRSVTVKTQSRQDGVKWSDNQAEEDSCGTWYQGQAIPTVGSFQDGSLTAAAKLATLTRSGFRVAISLREMNGCPLAEREGYFGCGRRLREEN